MEELDEEVQEFLTSNGLNSLQEFEEILTQRTFQHRVSVGSLKELVDKELSTLRKQYGSENRRVTWIDPENQQKSAKSVINKIIHSEEQCTFKNFDSKMEDLVRFRVICNYLSDVEEVVQLLRYSNTIMKRYDLLKDEDRIYTTRIKGHTDPKGVRDHCFCFHDKQVPEVKIEVQVMTLLQLSWDQKDHSLIYEKERQGIKVSDKDRIKMKSMSDLLYIADEFFNQLRQKMLNKEKRTDR